MGQVLVLPQTGALSQVSLPQLTDRPTDRPTVCSRASKCLSLQVSQSRAEALPSGPLSPGAKPSCGD